MPTSTSAKCRQTGRCGPPLAEGGGQDAELAAVYAELVAAYGHVLRPEVVKLPERSAAWPKVGDHLEQRLSQARRGEIVVPVLNIADRLHGELNAVAGALF